MTCCGVEKRAKVWKEEEDERKLQGWCANVVQVDETSS
jgi:hypothetical protein